MREQVETLEYHANFTAHFFQLFHVAVDLTATYLNHSPLMVLKLIDTTDHGRFSRPRGPANNNTLSLLDRKINVF